MQVWAKYKYYLLLSSTLIAIGFMESLKPKETVWLESYSKFDKIPYGNFILFNELGSIFSKQTNPSFESLHNSLVDSLSNTNLIIINNSFEAEQNDVNALLEFVNRGNQVMIISRKITDVLLDTLELSINVDLDITSGTENNYYLSRDTTQYNGPIYNKLLNTYFDSLSLAQPLGYRSDSLVNFIGLAFGKGRIYIHLLPSAFTNVCMLTNNNAKYISSVLSYLPNQATLWDEYYKARKKYIKQTPFQHILNTDGLRQSLYLTLLGTLTYMIFASKRKQRAIPVLPPKLNTTIEFIETIGKLYFNESDNKDIGRKRMNYFLADIREKYRINTEKLDKAFSLKLSTLSGVKKGEIDRLIYYYKIINTTYEVKDYHIIEQDKLIENFYNKEKLYGK